MLIDMGIGSEILTSVSTEKNILHFKEVQSASKPPLSVLINNALTK
jgi:hypothetical protein